MEGEIETTMVITNLSVGIVTINVSGSYAILLKIIMGIINPIDRTKDNGFRDMCPTHLLI